MNTEEESYRLVITRPQDGVQIECSFSCSTSISISDLLDDLVEGLEDDQGNPLWLRLPGMPIDHLFRLQWIQASGQMPPVLLDMDKTLADYGIPGHEVLELMAHYIGVPG